MFNKNLPIIGKSSQMAVSSPKTANTSTNLNREFSMKRNYPLTAIWPARLMVAAGLLTGGYLTTASSSRAADKYDSDLERRVETLERELNIMEGDKKGKNVEEAEVPTFLKAGNKNVKELVITGEMRFRYEYANADGQPGAATAGTEGQSSRERFRLRLFADYKLSDNFYFGVAVQTSLAADSGNTTFSEGFDNYSLYLWRAFLGYKFNDNITLVAGKMPNPFYSSTELLWDADISPTGLAQQFKLPVSPTFELAVNLGEFIFNDNSENAQRNAIDRFLPTGAANPAFTPGGNNNTDAYLVYGQVVATYKPTNTLTVTGAGGFQTYLDNGGTGTPGAANVINTGVNYAGAGNGAGQAGNILQNTGAFNSPNAGRNLFLGTFSGDVKIALGAFKVKVYGDAVYNFRGGSRNAEEYGLPGFDETQDKVAFATGLTVGSDYTLKKKGDYLVLAEYRQVGLGSIDPNLNDSDFNGSRLGFRGVKGAVSYAIYPWLFGTVTGFFGTNIGSERNLNLPFANFNSSRTIQVDLTAKF